MDGQSTDRPAHIKREDTTMAKQALFTDALETGGISWSAQQVNTQIPLDLYIDVLLPMKSEDSERDPAIGKWVRAAIISAAKAQGLVKAFDLDKWDRHEKAYWTHKNSPVTSTTSEGVNAKQEAVRKAKAARVAELKAKANGK